MIHLDTSFLIGMLNAESAASGERIVVSAVAWAGFLCGPVELAERDLALWIVDDFRRFDSAGLRLI